MRRRLWFNDGMRVRLLPQYSGRRWSYDFVMDRTHDGEVFRILILNDEHSCQCVRSMTSPSSGPIMFRLPLQICCSGIDRERQVLGF